MQPQFGNFQPGQSSLFSHSPVQDGALSGSGNPDISPSTPIWPQAEYTCSPNSITSQALYSPYLQDSGSPFENEFKAAVPANNFSVSELRDVPVLDSDLPWPTAGDALTFSTGTYTSCPYFEPPRLQFDEHTASTREKPRQFNDSPPTLRMGVKRLPYTPAWTTAKTKTDSGKQSPKRYKQAETSRGPGIKSSRPSSSGSESDHGSTKERRNHNLVEKKYRNRLNGHFDRLLSALPPAHDGTVSRDGNGQQERRVSKSEVLIMAKDHIAALEERRATLEQQKRKLLNNIKDLKAAWSGMGGERLP